MTPAAVKLSSLLSAAGVRTVAPPASDPTVLGVATDSRRVEAGQVFVAVRGFKTDGLAYIPDALARGASAVVAAAAPPPSPDLHTVWVQVENARQVAALLARAWFGRPDEAMALVGITGTNGKTTVAHFVEAMARAAGRAAGRIGTVGYAYGGREIPADRTTPGSVEFYDLLSAMREAGVEVVAMEVSSHALALKRVEGAAFAVAAFLNLGRDHLDFHGSQEAYFEAKASLFDRLDPGATAVLPAEDPLGDALRRRTRARVITFGRSAEAQVRLLDERPTAGVSAATLATPAGAIEVETRLLGRINLENVAAASACALALGLPVEAVRRGAASLRSVPGRLERVEAGQPFGVFVDYAHTEQALARMLEAVREVTAGRILLVFGCGGDRDRGKRPAMGRVAAGRADLLFVTSDNPRGEDPRAIVEEIAAGVGAVTGASDRCRVVLDRSEAIALAIREARPGDAVVVAGKGHETTQTFAIREEHFDDREAAREALQMLGFQEAPRAGA